jgi:hypothetical protein
MPRIRRAGLEKSGMVYGTLLKLLLQPKNRTA